LQRNGIIRFLRVRRLGRGRRKRQGLAIGNLAADVGIKPFLVEFRGGNARVVQRIDDDRRLPVRVDRGDRAKVGIVKPRPRGLASAYANSENTNCVLPVFWIVLRTKKNTWPGV
jgi:hypothetical protein